MVWKKEKDVFRDTYVQEIQRLGEPLCLRSILKPLLLASFSLHPTPYPLRPFHRTYTTVTTNGAATPRCAPNN